MVIHLGFISYSVASEAKASHWKHKARMKAMEAKKTSTIDHLHDATSRSFEDHGKMKQRVHQEKAKRQAAWAERGEGAIEIQGSGAFTGMDYIASPAPQGAAGAGEVDIYDHGDDLSGLQALKSQVRLDNTDADFDAELSEINRGIDSDLAEGAQSAAKKVSPKK